MYIRKWLNKKKGSSFIEVDFSGYSRRGEGRIKIADCHRSITLNFYKSTADMHGGTKDTLAKFDTLIETLQAAKEEFMKNE